MKREDRERLAAYISPNRVITPAQDDAFNAAVDAQVEFEQQNAESAEMPSDVQSFSIGNYSVSYAGKRGAAYTQSSICPSAWAFLYNAGLLRRELPIARRL